MYNLQSCQLPRDLKVDNNLNKLMYNLNNDTQIYTILEDYNQWLKRLDTQLNEPTNQNSRKVPKVVKSTNKKTLYYKTMGTIEINSGMSPPFLLTFAVANN